MVKQHKTKPLWVYLFAPVLFTGVFWLIHLWGLYVNEIPKIGVKPRALEGIVGVITMPFFHGDWSHLIGNSMSFLLLFTALLMFYRDLGYKVFLWIYFGGGVWLWCFGRPANHIGASGLIYGLFAFLAFSGLLRRHKPLIAISFLVLFLYGSMIWGVFPIEVRVSWEGHLMSLLWGIVLSIYYRSEGPQKIETPVSDDDTRNEARFGEDYWKTEQQLAEEYHSREEDEGIKIVFHYKPTSPDTDEKQKTPDQE